MIFENGVFIQYVDAADAGICKVKVYEEIEDGYHKVDVLIPTSEGGRRVGSMVHSELLEEESTIQRLVSEAINFRKE